MGALPGMFEWRRPLGLTRAESEGGGSSLFFFQRWVLRDFHWFGILLVLPFAFPWTRSNGRSASPWPFFSVDNGACRAMSRFFFLRASFFVIQRSKGINFCHHENNCAILYGSTESRPKGHWRHHSSLAFNFLGFVRPVLMWCCRPGRDHCSRIHCSPPSLTQYSTYSRDWKQGDHKVHPLDEQRYPPALGTVRGFVQGVVSFAFCTYTLIPDLWIYFFASRR